MYARILVLSLIQFIALKEMPVFPGCQLVLILRRPRKEGQGKIRKQIWFFIMKENVSPALRHSYLILLAASKLKPKPKATTSKATTVIRYSQRIGLRCLNA